MGKYLKKFQTDNDYQAFKSDGTKMLIPNVSYIKNGKYCYFTPLNGTPSEPEQPEVVYPTIHATFNATADNMLALGATSCVKSLKIDGETIKFDTPQPKSQSINLMASNMSINTDTGECTLPDDYLVSTTNHIISMTLKPMDTTINNINYFALILSAVQDGVNMTMASPLPLEFCELYINGDFNKETQTITMTNHVFDTLSNSFGDGVEINGIIFCFCKLNDNGELEIIDTVCETITTPTRLECPYYFQTEGEHVAEIELIENGSTSSLFTSVSNDGVILSCLTSIDFMQDITDVGARAFLYSSISSITIPESVKIIAHQAFQECGNLESINLGNGIIKISSQAFLGVDSLTEITIPDTVTSIGYCAFQGCSNLTSVYCKATTPPCADARGGAWDAFDNNASGRKIYVPMESVDAYKAAPGWSEYADAIVGYNF